VCVCVRACVCVFMHMCGSRKSARALGGEFGRDKRERREEGRAHKCVSGKEDLVSLSLSLSLSLCVCVCGCVWSHVRVCVCAHACLSANGGRGRAGRQTV
jgi:hypothetical protein